MRRTPHEIERNIVKSVVDAARCWLPGHRFCPQFVRHFLGLHCRFGTGYGLRSDTPFESGRSVCNWKPDAVRM